MTTAGISRPLVGLWFFLAFPSVGVVQKFLGNGGVVAYAVGAALMLWLCDRVAFGFLLDPAREKLLKWCAALCFVGLAAAFAVVYPLANSGTLGRGSDADEALDIATRTLLGGQFPYYSKTYLGNPISPLPGSLLLAAPFVLAGGSAYQNFFWLALLPLGAAFYVGGARIVLLLLTAFLLSPILFYLVIVGSDYIANTIFVLLFSLWLLRAAAHGQQGRLASIVAVLLGVALASRTNFALILPLLFAALAARQSTKGAAKYLSLSVLTFLLLCVPFYLHDPRHFSPLHTANKLGRYEYLLPHAGAAIPLLSAVLALWLARRDNSSLALFLRHCAFVLAFPALWVVALDSLALWRLSLRFASFGVFALLFGVLGFWPWLLEMRVEVRGRATGPKNEFPRA